MNSCNISSKCCENRGEEQGIYIKKLRPEGLLKFFRMVKYENSYIEIILSVEVLLTSRKAFTDEEIRDICGNSDEESCI